MKDIAVIVVPGARVPCGLRAGSFVAENKLEKTWSLKQQ